MEGLLSTGPTPSSFSNKQYLSAIDYSFIQGAGRCVGLESFRVVRVTQGCVGRVTFRVVRVTQGCVGRVNRIRGNVVVVTFRVADHICGGRGPPTEHTMLESDQSLELGHRK